MTADATPNPDLRLPQICVLVITFRRPQGLAALLQALATQVGDGERFHLSSVVCDNDEAGSARSAGGLPNVVYVAEPRRGIPLARNAALAAVASDTDFICFIDDDEVPPADWIDRLLATQRATGGDAVLGPIVPRYPPGSEGAWVVRSRLLERRRNPDGARITYGATNNILVSWPFVRDHDLRFDERMRFTGGSDYRFFRIAQAKGLSIFWCDGAVVEEDVPPERMRLSWVLARQFRTGNTYAIDDRLEGGAGRLLRRVATGLARIGLGIVMLPALPFSPRLGGRALVHVLRGAGMVAGVFGGIYEEYRPVSSRS